MTNIREDPILESPNTRRRFDLEQRTLRFTRDVVQICKNLARTVSNLEYDKQVIRSSASIGSNYIEANEALGKKDFLMRIRICRKEAKETAYWLQILLLTNDQNFRAQAIHLYDEAVQLKKIFSAMVLNVESQGLKKF